jgi:hypothetical protein
MLETRKDGAGRLLNQYAAAVLYNETSPEWVAVAERKLGFEPMSIMATPLTSTSERYGSMMRACIGTLHDRALPIATQRSIQAVLPCDPVFTLDTDHCPFFSKPELLMPYLLAQAA